MIVWDQVTKIFNSDLLTKPVTALDNVSFGITEGSMTGFLGANGAGKTTSLKVALGFTKPNGGTVKFSVSLGGNRASALSRIGFLPERPYFYPHLTGKEFSTYMGSLSGMKSLQLAEMQKKYFERLGLESAQDRPLRTYSKGMLQRLGFMVAIQHDPALIVLDEPLSGLDPVGRKELKDIMADVHKEGKTIFFSTHIVSDVEERCDRVIFLRQGKMVYDGEVASLLNRSSGRHYRFSLEASETAQWQTPTISKSFHGGVWTIRTDVDQREPLLAEALRSGAKVQSVAPEGATLENIFYGLGQ